MKYSEYMRKKREEEEKSGNKSQTSSRTYSSLTQYKEAQGIGLDTLESDLKSLSTSIGDTYGGWQTSETMANTKSSVEAMNDRLSRYQEYQKKYGGTDLSDVASGYKSVLDDWDNLASTYGHYKNADAYNKALQKTKFDKDFAGLTYEQVQAKKKKYGEGTDEYEYLSNYTGYTSLKDFNKALEDAGASDDKVKVKGTYLENKNNEKPEYLASSYSANNNDAKAKDETYADKLKTAMNQYKLDNGSEIYEYLKENEDFSEKSQYKSTKVDSAWDRMTSRYGLGYGDLTYEYINNVDGIRDEISSKASVYGMDSKNMESDEGKNSYDRMNADEVAIYNYIYATEGKKEAEKYLDDIQVTLSKREYDEKTKSWMDVVDSSKLAEVGMSALSVPANLIGGVTGGIDALGDFLRGKEYNPYSYYKMPTNFSADSRGYVGENIAERTEGIELPIIDNPFVTAYNIGMSTADSMASMLTFGPKTDIIMASNAFQQKAKQLKEEGASETEVLSGAFASGTAEYIWERFGIGKLLNIKNSDSFSSVIKNLLKQSGEEMFGEVMTEATNILSDIAIRGDESEYAKMYEDYIARGYTPQEAFSQTFVDGAKQIAQAGIAGAVSGGVMGGLFAGGQYSDLKSKGQQLKANERTQDIMDMFTPEEAETYELYNKYANKGVTAENIKDAQLGNLYETKSDYAKETYNSSKSTNEQKVEAVRTMDALSNYMNTKGVTTKNGEKVSIDGVKTVDGETVFVTNQGEMNASDLNLSANETKMAEYTEDMSEEMKNAFVSNYDGKSDIDTYKAYFDLAYAYGETRSGHSALFDKTTLTAKQIDAIYMAGKESSYKKQEAVVQKLKEEYTKDKFIKGKVNDSVIDYTDSGKGEVNWKDLSSIQRANVTFQNALYTGLGIDVKWTTKGKEEGFNGHYDKDTNAITLDIYADIDKDNKQASDDFKLAIVRTSSHELTHWLEVKTPALYAKLEGQIFDALYKVDGHDKETRIQAKIKYLEKLDKNFKRKSDEAKRTEAIAEIVAEGCEDMLSMSEIGRETLRKLTKKERKTIFDKVKGFYEDAMVFVDKMLGTYKSNSYEASTLREKREVLEGAYEEILKTWEEAMRDAVEVNQAMKSEGLTDKALIESVEKVGISIDAKTESAYPSEEFSRRTWEESDYVTNREVASKNLAKSLGISQKKALKYIDNINSVARMIADDKVRLDYEPNMDDSASVMKPNSDYKWSIDMSTLCAKRLLFTGTFDAIQKALPNTVFTSEDIVKLRKMMMDRAYEVACGICYVESTRREIGAITQQFIDSYKESQRTGKPITRTNSEGKVVELKKTQDQMKTTVDKSTDRFIADKDYTPTLGDLNTTDIDIVKKEHPLVYEAYLNFMNARGQSKPKLLETRAEYKGEVAKTYKKKKDGSLNNSTVTMNASGGLRLQLFSDFEVAHLIDMMQVVMDMSNVGLYSQAYTKVPAFAEVFGDTGVKINLSLIAKGSGLDNDGNLIFDDVEGINHEEAFRLREKYSKNVGTILVGKNDAHIIKAMADPRIDYIIPFHKSSWKESLYDALGLTGYDDYTDTQHEKPIQKNRKISDFKPSEYWDYSKSGDENAKIYLEKCKEDGRIPKFPQFQTYEGYWKLLIDFKMYDNDGVGSPQTTVTPNFDMESAMRILSEYEGGHRNLPVAKDVVDDFVNEYRQYSRRDSEGAELTDAQIEYFKDSKVRDNDGNLLRMYHGSRNQFTVFDREKIGSSGAGAFEGAGFNFTPSETRAISYGANAMKGYINVKNPLSSSEKTFTVRQLADVIAKVDPTGDDIISNYCRETRDYGTHSFIKRESLVTARAIMGYAESDVDIYSELSASGGRENLIEAFSEMGYDGLIHYYDDGNIKTVITFNSNQFKDIDNANPTSDDDIRFARRYDDSFDFLEDKELIKEAKKVARAKVKERDEKIEKNTRIERIKKNSKLLTEYLKKNTKNKHITDDLKGPVRDLLVSIDYATRKGGMDASEQKNALAKVEQNVLDARKKVDLRANLTALQMSASEDEMLLRAGVDFSSDIEAITKSLENLDLKTDTVFVLKDMSLEDVTRLDRIIRTLRTVITRANYYSTLRRKITISASAHELFDLFDSLGEVKEGKIDGAKDFFNYDNVTPIWFFDRLGPVGKDLFQAFVRGQSRQAFNIVKAKEFSDSLCSDDKKHEWDTDLIEFEVIDAKKTRDITKPVMKKVYTTTSRLMTLYLHDKREQSQGHLYKGGGGRFTTFEHKGKTYGEDVNGVVLTPQLVKQMLTKLDPEAKAVADNISVYLNTVCKDLGNEVTRDLYDVELFLEPKYIPIEVIKESVSRKMDKSAPSITALLNKGFTKETKPNAKNQIVLDSIFDVFAKHTAEMITYNAYAREVYDAVRLFEYNENRQTYVLDDEEGQTVSDNIQIAMRGAMGEGAVKYFRNFLEDVNGTQQAGRGNGLLNKAFSNSKLANVAWNMNVVILQPLALCRAMISIHPKYLAKGLFGIKSGMKSAMEHSGTAIYKSLGYYDTDISLPFAEQIKGDKTFGDKMKELSMKGAGFMDEVTWGALWKACEHKVLAENKGLTRNSDGFYDKVVEIFDETVYRTQVMDSVLSRSQIMRDKNLIKKGLTSFMAEPLVTYNTVYGVFSEWNQYSRQGHSVSECSKKCGKKLAVAIGVYCISSLAEAGVRTLTSAMRSAGDEEEKDENVFLEELLSALNPLSKIPVFRELVSAMQGYGVSKIPALNTIEAFVNAYKTIGKIIIDGEEVSYKKVYKLLNAVSSASGHGLSNAYRDIVAIWNSTIGQMYPSLIIKTDE